MSHNVIGRLVPIVAVVAAVVCGCAHPHTTSPDPLPKPSPSAQPITPHSMRGVNDSDPDTVIRRAVELVYTWSPNVDADTSAGFDRAATLMDPDYLREVGPTASGLATVTDADWQRWRTENTEIAATAVITADDHPADTDTEHDRVVALTQHIAAGVGEPDRDAVVYVRAVRAGPDLPWRIRLLAPR